MAITQDQVVRGIDSLNLDSKRNVFRKLAIELLGSETDERVLCDDTGKVLAFFLPAKKRMALGEYPIELVRLVESVEEAGCIDPSKQKDAMDTVQRASERFRRAKQEK